MAEITLDHITKRYPDGYEAVSDMSLEIADGEFVILVGPSGCGKSTALRMIAGLEDITRRRARIGGEVVNDKAPKDRDIAMVFQNYALYPHMSVRDNMGFALKLRKMDQSEIDEKVNEAARILDLEQHLERKPAQLSGGQRQRVAMGRAIVRDPAVFLMDEPLSNLDAKLRVQMRTEVSRIQDRLGTTTVYVTHDQTEALTLGDRVAVMRAGTHPAGGLAHGSLQPPGEPVRGRVHRLAGHELHARRDRGRLGEAAARERAAAAGGARARGPGRGTQPDRGHPPGELRGRAPRRRRPRPRHHLQGQDRGAGVDGLGALRPLQGGVGLEHRVRGAAGAGRGRRRRRGADGRRGGPHRGPARPGERGQAGRRRPSYGWTRIACSSSTRRTEATSWWRAAAEQPAATP